MSLALYLSRFRSSEVLGGVAGEGASPLAFAASTTSRYDFPLSCALQVRISVFNSGDAGEKASAIVAFDPRHFSGSSMENRASAYCRRSAQRAIGPTIGDRSVADDKDAEAFVERNGRRWGITPAHHALREAGQILAVRHGQELRHGPIFVDHGNGAERSETLSSRTVDALSVERLPKSVVDFRQSALIVPTSFSRYESIVRCR